MTTFTWIQIFVALFQLVSSAAGKKYLTNEVGDN